MQLDLPKFYKACNPSRALVVGKPNDQKYYIDFSSVRGSNMIRELERTITLLAPEEATCQLFTGHIGCGKSTELMCLKSNLEQKGFHVVYFESSQDKESPKIRNQIRQYLEPRTNSILEAINKDLFGHPIPFLF